MSMVLEQRVAGVPVHRFRFTAKGPGGVEEQKSFVSSWERSSKMYAIQKQGFEVSATNWNKDTDTWDDATQAALTEGHNRAERAKNSNGKAPVAKEVKPVISADAHSSMKAHADLVKMVANSFRKDGVEDAAKNSVGMSAMEMLTHAGYTPQEIFDLCKSYVTSLKAQAHPQN